MEMDLIYIILTGLVSGGGGMALIRMAETALQNRNRVIMQREENEHEDHLAEQSLEKDLLIAEVDIKVEMRAELRQMQQELSSFKDTAISEMKEEIDSINDKLKKSDENLTACRDEIEEQLREIRYRGSY